MDIMWDITDEDDSIQWTLNSRDETGPFYATLSCQLGSRGGDWGHKYRPDRWVWEVWNLDSGSTVAEGFSDRGEQAAKKAAEAALLQSVR